MSNRRLGFLSVAFTLTISSESNPGAQMTNSVAYIHVWCVYTSYSVSSRILTNVCHPHFTQTCMFRGCHQLRLLSPDLLWASAKSYCSSQVAWNITDVACAAECCASTRWLLRNNTYKLSPEFPDDPDQALWKCFFKGWGVCWDFMAQWEWILKPLCVWKLDHSMSPCGWVQRWR